MGSAYVQIAAAVLKAGGSVLGGNAEKQAAYDQASQVRTDAFMHAAAIRKAADATRGEATAAYAGAGVDVSQGTPLAIDSSITYNSEFDALNAISSGEATAASLRRSGKAAKTASILGAAGSAAQSYSSWQSSAKGG